MPSEATVSALGAPTPPIPERLGSRRRRLWELGPHAHCLVIGVCLPLPAARRLADKVLGGQVQASDYALHCGVNSDCRQRSPMAEAVQKELERRYLLAVRHSQTLKTTEALAQWWQAQRQGDQVAGALWATLTHPRCDAALEERVLQDIHLLQHQAGAANRADLARQEAVMEENRVLAGELARVQQRCTRQAGEQAARLERLQAELMLARAALISRDTLVAALKEDLSALEATPAAAAGPALKTRSVLCVGGRQASVPAYRELVEHVGGRFLHHDGGEEDHITRLDHTLAAADLVICQTGCISHNAYWRVKDHCKRTGKPCVFVDNPSTASLRRALFRLCPVEGSP